MIDTHAHIYSSKFDGDRDEVIKRAFSEGLEYILMPNIDLESIGPMLEVSAKYKKCLPMMGLHPCSIDDSFELLLQQVKKELFESKNEYIAVGEIGIDLYWDKTFLEQQIKAFRVQVKWAKELCLPIVVHARESYSELLNILDEENDDRLTGVFHCFSGNQKEASHILSYGGFKLGIGGTVTYKKSELPSVLEGIDLSHIIIETDAPYLSPRPFRGKRNESSYVKYVVGKLAEIYDCSEDHIIANTSRNAKVLFNIKDIGYE
jgi:TatD DNase family protein